MKDCHIKGLIRQSLCRPLIQSVILTLIISDYEE